MIKTLIFDFGDVFINLDKTAPGKGLKTFGINQLSKDMEAINQAYEMGLVSSYTLMEFYLEQIPKAKTTDLMNIWNSILLDFPLHRLEFLKKLREENKFQLFLLSNTNELHIDSVKENISFYEDFKACFDKFYLSYEIGFRKPNADIYEFVLQDNNLTPEKCFFIDDTEENTITAEKLGIKSWNINPLNDDVSELFIKNSNIF